MKVEVIDSLPAAALRSREWETLREADPRASVFLSPVWLLNWLAHFGEGKEMRFFWVADERGPVALFPFISERARWRRLAARRLTYCINPSSVRGGYIALAGREREALVALRDCLTRLSEWDLIVADGNPAAIPWFDHCDEGVHRGETWAHSALTIRGSWQDYFHSLPQNFRRNLRRTERDLEKLGPVDFCCASEPAEIDHAMSALFAIDGASWKAERGETIGANAHVASYYSGIARGFTLAGKLVIAMLQLRGEPIAMILAMHDKGVLYTLKTSFKSAIGSARVSPGNLVMLHLLKEAWQRGYREVDFVCRQPYTERWTANVRLFRQDLLFDTTLYGRTLNLVDSAYRRVAPFLNRRLARGSRA